MARLCYLFGRGFLGAEEGGHQTTRESHDVENYALEILSIMDGK